MNRSFELSEMTAPRRTRASRRIPHREARDAGDRRTYLRRLALLQKTWTRVKHRAARQASLYFRSAGCIYSIRGECTMCGYINGTIGEGRMMAEDLIAQFEAARNELDGDVSVVALYNSGSFFDERQFPTAARAHVLAALASAENVEKVVVESRPEFIAAGVIEQARRLLGKKRLEVGIGLESASDLVRNTCLNKQFTSHEFEGAVQLLRSHSADVMAYIFLKPPYLTEWEAVDDAVETIRYAFSHGIDRVMVEPAFVQEGTPMAAMFAIGEYRTPWLWSVLAVLRETDGLGQIGVGYPDDVPPPIFAAKNCDACSGDFWAFFDEFNRTGALAPSDNLRCPCKMEWLDECVQADEALEERLARLVTKGGLT